MDLNALQATIRTFASDRNWEKLHTPKNLSMALMVEAAELMELFQWKTPEESREAKLDPALRTRIGEELADVLLYLLQLADQTGVDLEHAVDDKLSKNAKKHPLPDSRAPTSQQVVRPAQTHVLVDWENVQPKDVDIRALAPDVTNVWIFHGPNQKRVGDHQKSFGDALTLVPISRTGKNSLDFHLSYYVGYISSRNPEAKFMVVSNDLGYAPMLEHAKDLGFAASQVGFGAPREPVKQTAATQSPAKKVPVKKTAPAKKPSLAKPVKVAKVPAAKKSPKILNATTVGSATKAPVGAKSAKKPAPAKKVAPSKSKAKKAAPTAMASATLAKPSPVPSKKLPAQDFEKTYAHVLASLRKSKNKPTREARLYGAVKSLLGAENADEAGVQQIVSRLVDEGHLVMGSTGAVTKAP